MTGPGSPSTSELAIAEARVRVSRERLMATLQQLQDKVSPRNLAQDAVDNAVETVRTRPQAVAAVAAGLTLIVLRKPLFRLLRRGAGHATGTATTSYKI